jgi:type IV pilus assembly protein PilC
MAIYLYKALNKKGEVVKGEATANNEKDLEMKLLESGLDLFSINEKKSFSFPFFGGVGMKELILVCIHLYQLEKSGVSILDSIADLRDTTESQSVRTVMMDLYDELKNGKLLSEAMKNHPKVFDNVFVGLIGAGEKTGSFVEAFGHLQYHLKWVYELRTRVMRAIYYPVFLVILMLTVMIVMMVMVIPKLSILLSSLNIEMPWYTTALLATSDVIINYWYVLLSLPVIIFIGLRLASSYSRKVRYKLDQMVLKIPIIGGILLKIDLARFCHFFSITYKSGMGIIECLQVSKEVLKNAVLHDSIEEVQNNVFEGMKLNDALIATGKFPKLVTRMFGVGENSGNLDQALKNINEFYDREVNDAINTFVEMLQPLLTLVMGLMLMWITFSVFGPVYSSFQR